MTATILITDIQKEILKALLYFDVFSYPLSSREIYENTAVSTTHETIEQELRTLLSIGIVKQSGDFYSISESIVTNTARRLEGNKLAKEMLVKANEISKKISNFPFVSGVCISGGLSKNYFDANSDFDFFIITKPNRLWISRTLYIVLFKLFSKEKQKLYCLNYFISEADLTINDQNLFVATELAYLIPTVNHSLYRKLLQNNFWYKEYFKNKDEAISISNSDLQESRLKKLIEFFFIGKFGNWMDSVFLNMTLNRWRKKYPEMSNEDFELQFRSKKHVCKRHTYGYQNKILQMFSEKIGNFESKFQIELK
ncbi:MAG: hypothetical protein K9H41_05775 [Bacteroidia bacterium]|nr:hypothetical protein [Bacteroidia bacterium]